MKKRWIMSVLLGFSLCLNAESNVQNLKNSKSIYESLRLKTYQIKKNSDNSFLLKDKDDEPASVVSAVGTQKDLLIFDALSLKNLLMKGFFTSKIKVGEWYPIYEVDSPTGIFWVINNKPQLTFVQYGMVLEQKNFEVIKTPNSDEFIIKELGKAKYKIIQSNSKEYETFYPLELLKTE